MKKFLLLLIFTFFACAFFTVAAEGVNINTASLEQLDKIIGIGPALAQRIIDDRPFLSVDDLLKVKGIGEKTLQKIKDQGLAYVNGNPNDQIQISNKIQNLNDQKITVATPIIYPTGIYINEILPSPQGADETEEWFEIFNSNNFDVDLSDWQVKDTAGTITTYTIPKNTKILANGYLVFKRPETKIMLNNEEDGLNLLMPNEKITDSVIFTKAPLGQSYNKISGGWQWSKTLTLGSANIIVLEALPKQKKSGNSKNIETVAALGETANPIRNEISNGINPWFLFLTALIITIVSTIVVLLIKLRLKPKT